MTTQLTSPGSTALMVTVPDETFASEWASPAHCEIGTLPLSRLRRIIAYIRAHLDQDLTLAQLGAVFARLFQRSTGLVLGTSSSHRNGGRHGWK